MSALELKIPPLAVVALAGLLMWALAVATPALSLAVPGDRIAAAALGLCGMALAAAGGAAFRRAGTTIDPRVPHESRALVTGGIYRFSRNPMYLGLVLILLAWAVLLSNVASLLAVAAVAAYLTRFQIVPEERALRAHFGDAYAAYWQRVRRWI